MKLISVKISNILSFKYYEDIAMAKEIVFIDQENAEASQLNVLIGSNGSGKSNFIEILQYALKTKLFPIYLKAQDGYSFNQEPIQKELPKHYNYNKDPQSIQLKIQLNNQDFENIIKINTHIDKIKGFFKENEFYKLKLYESKINCVKQVSDKIKIRKDEIIIVTITGNNILQSQMSIMPENLSYLGEVLPMIGWFEKIFNLYNKLNHNKLPPISQTFLLMPSSRNCTDIPVSFSINGHENSEQPSANAKDQQIHRPQIFEKLGQEWASESHRLIYNENSPVTFLDAIICLKESNKYQLLMNTIKDILDLDFDIEIRAVQNIHTLFFKFYDNRFDISHNISSLQSLSTGQRSIIYLLFEIIANDVRNGLVFIDEPELHLHPQLHKKYLSILTQLESERKIQFIMATHSSEFINEATIKKTYKFKWNVEEKSTEIHHYQSAGLNNGSIIQILNYMGGGRLFFVDKVIFVEGDSDKYFLKSYLEWLGNNKKIKFNNYEIFQIGGK